MFLAGALNRSWRYQGARALSAVGNTVSGLGVGGKALGLTLDSIGALVKAPIAGAATAVINLTKGIVELGKSAVQAFSEIEAIKVQLGVVFSNQTQADSMFGQIAQYAVKSPFGVQQASELAVLLKQSGVYASDLMDTLRMLGDTAGGNMEKMKRIANNYAQIVSIGKASMLDMRQFAYAGIPIFEAVSKELNVSQQELRKLISDGKVTSDIIEKVFKDLTGINGIFENATEKGAKTLKARLQNLSDARQLAMSSLGQGFVDFGQNYGNDSYAKTFISGLENFWTWVREHVNTKNIENDVKTIANNNLKLESLNMLLEYAKNNGDKDLQKIIEKEIEIQKNIFDPDKMRQIYSSSYDIKNAAYKRFGEKYGYLTEDEIIQKRLAAEKIYYEQREIQQKDIKYGNRGVRYLSDEERTLVDTQVSVQKQIIDEMNAYLKALKDATETTEDEVRAHREINVINAQQLSYDRTNKNADAATSTMSLFQELTSIYRNSEEYQREQEEKKVELLKEAKEDLKYLMKYADALDNLDITKLTDEEILRYYNKGAFRSTEKLTVTEGKTRNDLRNNRQLLMSQITAAAGGAQQLISDMAKNLGIGPFSIASTPEQQRANILHAEAQEFATLFTSLKNLSDEEFYREFAQKFDRAEEILLDFQSAFTDDKDRTQKSITLLELALNRQGIDSTGANANPEDILKGKSVDTFIPLWKRILSSVTGLSTTGMTSTIQTLTNYRDDMAIRNMASDVLKVTMRSMGVDAAMGLMRAGSAVQLTGDSGKTLQVDWKATRKAIKDFATQLSASTEVITAYKNGLQAELDVYEQLVAAGYTQAESMDLGSQKFVSSKQLAKLGLGNQSQLVNAFGEVIETASGKKYSVEDIKFINGEMYDSLGNKIEEEVVVTGNLFEFIKGELPRIYNELREANAKELNNQVLSSMYQDILSTQLVSNLIQERGVNATTKFLASNPDYIKNSIKPTLEALKNNNITYNSVLGDMTSEDILTYAQMANTGYLDNKLKQYNNGEIEALEYMREKAKIQEASKIVADLFKVIETSADELVGSEVYELLKKSLGSKSIQDAVTKAYLLDVQRQQYGLTDPNNLRPRDYGGSRGLRNLMQGYFIGEDIAYDREDFIAETMKANKEKYGELDLTKTNGELAKMLSFSEQFFIMWDKGWNDVGASLDKFAYSLGQTLTQFASTALTSTFSTWGQAIAEGADASEALESNFRKLNASLLSSLGTMITEAGLSMAIHASSMPEVLAGLGLAAVGGAASWLSGYLGVDKSSKATDDEEKKLEGLRDDLKKLLEQARADALYYEKNLRHRTALGINEKFSYKSVNDAIITPKGVVMTHPQDYLIATKTPQAMGNVNVTPVINCNVVNNTNAKIRQEQTQNADGSIDITTIIEEAVGGYIASARSDDAFNARQYRLNGRQSVM